METYTSKLSRGGINFTTQHHSVHKDENLRQKKVSLKLILLKLMLALMLGIHVKNIQAQPVPFCHFPLQNSDTESVYATGINNFIPFGEFYKWDKRIITYYFLNGTNDITNNNEHQIVREALAKWQSNTDLLFIESCDSNADILIKWCFEDFPLDPQEFAGAANRPKNGDIYFNDYLFWTTSVQSGNSVMKIALHEIGHALGLDHSDVVASVMRENNLTYFSNLYQDDINGIQSLYGPPKPDFWEYAGPKQFCPNASYSVNLPAGCTIQWSVSGPALINGPSNQASVNLTANGNGTVYLKRAISYGCKTINFTDTISIPKPSSLIIGPDKICDNTANYQIINPPSGANIIWTASGALEIIGSFTTSSITVNKKYNGDGWLQADISSACGNQTLYKKSIKVGPPYNLTVTAGYQVLDMNATKTQGTSSDYIPLNTDVVIFHVAYIPGINYQWKINGVVQPTAIGFNNDCIIQAPICNPYQPNQTNYTVEVSLSNECGTTIMCRKFAFYCTPSPYIVPTWDCNSSPNPTPIPPIEVEITAPNTDFVISPNPSNNLLSVSQKTGADTESALATPSKKPFSLKLYDANGSMLKKGESKTGDDLTIDVSSVPNGTYFLHIGQGKNLIKKQVIIQHE